MPAPFPAARDGELVHIETSGFPLYFSRRKARAITADPLTLIEHVARTRLSADLRTDGLAYVEQAADFVEAARNPMSGSKPLLYYYTFLNLLKVLLHIRNVDIPPAARHGIADPRANFRERFRIDGQRIQISGEAHDHSELFPELVQTLGVPVTGPRSIRVLRVLAQIPAIHRTFLRITGEEPQFVPIKKIELRRKQGEMWCRVCVESLDHPTKAAFGRLRAREYFGEVFTQVATETDETWFETESVNSRGRAAEGAIASLSDQVKSTRMASILTLDGYHYYWSLATERDYLPSLAAPLAAIFYLGSITRYKPADFDKLRASKYGWLCKELLATQPLQLIYAFASEILGVDVVRVQAVVE
jgi:hypothetical protein